MMDCFITLKPNTLLAFLFILYIINRKGANQGAIVVYTLGEKIVTPGYQQHTTDETEGST